MTISHITHGFVDVDGVRVFYRDTGPADGIPVLLLHGFPTASHQYRRLMDALGARYRLIAPDYPGFGHTEAPADFVYSFDTLADVVEGFLAVLGIDRFVLYTFDFGGPVGLRLATRKPESIAALIVQNANAYDEGLSEMARETTPRPPKRSVTCSPCRSRAASTRAAPPVPSSSTRMAGPWTSTSWTFPVAGTPSSPSRWTTTPTSPTTRSGRRGCASTSPRR
ncbi:alpha/beta fold hydrolase [Nocardia asteroides]|uniref:alpha/beta fold hydrolase n=1 Tax=Nocardia asteroides TaxID=1824 RepID=UPI0037CC5E07